MRKSRKSGLAIAVAMSLSLVGAATYGGNVRPLTARELEETTAGQMYYCAYKTGGFVPDSGCSLCQDIGLLEVWVPDGNGGYVATDKNMWQKCSDQQGDDACQQLPDPGPVTPTCEKNSVQCGGTASFYMAADCTTTLPEGEILPHPSQPANCWHTRDVATNGTVTGVNCVNMPLEVF